MRDSKEYWQERLRACVDELAFIERCRKRARERKRTYEIALEHATREAAGGGGNKTKSSV